MANSCTEYIYSNDYADFTVDYKYDVESIYEKFNPICVNRITRKYFVAYKQIENIQQMPITEFGYSAFPKLYGLLDMDALEEIGVTDIRRIPNFDLTGLDVLIGFIDTGINYTLDIFKNEDNTTRIISIWDQEYYENEETSFASYGRVYTREEINTAIINENPYSIVKQRDEIGHGTTLASIAAGSYNQENDFIGVAPDSEIVVVKLKKAKEYLKDYYQIEEGAICYQDNDIMAGIQYLLLESRRVKKPLVICLGVGTNSGSHEGRDNLSQYIDDFSSNAGIAVVAAGGNEVASRHHYSGVMNITDDNDIDTIELSIGENVRGFSMEIWLENPNLASIAFRSPMGENTGVLEMRPSRSDKLNFLFDRTNIYVDMKSIEENTGNALIFIRFINPSQGIWNIDVYKKSKIEGRYDAWLPLRGLVSENVIFINSDPNTTLVSIANGAYSIAVSGYNGNTDGIYVNSSRGYTFDDRIKPDLAAPAVEVYGPNGRGDYVYHTGTSIASALTGGTVAMLLEWAITERNYLDIDSATVKKFLISGTVRSIDRNYPNREWGYGKLNIYEVFDNMRR